MANGQLGYLLRHIQRLIGGAPADESTDGQLLDRFISRQDEAAFETIVQRHGAMVLDVGQTVLGDRHAAEDVFQATFLVLATKARAVRKQDSVGSWLYKVAYRVALKLRSQAARRRHHERQTVNESRDTEETCLDPELRPLLLEELQRLPEKYRAPLVLCYLEGKTNEEAAAQLHWPVGSVKGRLSRARDVLRGRLTRRGIAVPAMALAATGISAGASQAMTAPLVKDTVRAAIRVVAGQAASGISPQVLALTHGVVKEMFQTKLKIAAACLLSFCLVGTGLGLLSYSSQAASGKSKASRRASKKSADQGAQADAKPQANPWKEVKNWTVKSILSNRSLMFSPDGKTLATINVDKIELWETATGKKRTTLTLPGNQTMHPTGAFSPDGSTLATADESGNLHFWDAGSGKHQASIKTGLVGFTTLAYSSDGKSLAVSGSDPKNLPMAGIGVGQNAFVSIVKCWDVASRKETVVLTKVPGSVKDLKFLRDNEVIATISDDYQQGQVMQWDLKTGKPKSSSKIPAMSMASFAGDGQAFAGVEMKWPQPVQGQQGQVQGQQGQVIMVNPAYKLTLRATATGKVLHTFKQKQNMLTESLAMAPTGDRLVTLASDGKGCVARVWNTRTGRLAGTFKSSLGFVADVAWIPDGTKLAVLGTDGNPNAGGAFFQAPPGGFGAIGGVGNLGGQFGNQGGMPGGGMPAGGGMQALGGVGGANQFGNLGGGFNALGGMPAGGAMPAPGFPPGGMPAGGGFGFPGAGVESRVSIWSWQPAREKKNP